MNRIAQTFKNNPAYIGYLTAGDGGLNRSLSASLALVEGGVNILEIGVPFSDPVADGLTIQHASCRSLEAGTTLNEVLKLIHRIRQRTDTPIILFTYYNPILAFGDSFYSRANEAGVDGCLVVDLPIEEAEKHLERCQQYQIDPILLLSPSTSLDRIEKISQHAKSMLYYVSRNGTTGVKSSLPSNFSENMKKIKPRVHLPVVAGFGISNAAMAKEVLQHANGFVVGSLFVDAIARGMSDQELIHLAKSIDPR